MSVTKLVSAISVIIVLAASSGCATYSSWEGQTAVNENWGKSYAMAKGQQILRPNAGKNTEPVTATSSSTTELIYMR